MKTANFPNHNRMTLLVLRDAGRPTKQIQVSKPLVVAVPLIALLSLSGLIVSLQWQSGHAVGVLKRQLEQQNLKFEAVVTDKNEAIKRLQSKVVSLYGQSQEMKFRMERVAEMESELEKFIDKYGSHSVPSGNQQREESTDKSKAGALSYLSWSPSNSDNDTAGTGMGGEFIAIHDHEAEHLAREAMSDFEEMSALLDEMEKSVPGMLREARQTQYRISGTPTEWPTLSTRLTSNFGYRSDPFRGRAAFHAGIDIAGNIGDPIYAAGAGKVITTDKDNSHGNYIVIEHPGGLQSWYLHLSAIGVNAGDTVTKGQEIGSLGNTGRSTGPHLHFEIVKKGNAVNPLPYLNKP